MKPTLKALCCYPFATLLAAVAWGHPPSGYTLRWSDEFDGNALDSTHWVYRTDSKHWSTQTPDNVTVAGGKLILRLRKENRHGKAYTGSGVISQATFRHGYFEARLKVPPGAGWHTSFWLMEHDGAGGTGTTKAAQELDICEQDSSHPHRYSVNVHQWNPGPHRSFGYKEVATPDLSAGFHVFGCEFTPETVIYFFDGELVRTVDGTTFPHGDQHVWLTSIASHLGDTRPVDDAQLPATAEFDWVRVYEKTPMPK